MSYNFSSTVAFIWSVVDLLYGDIKRSQYGRIILPFMLLDRLECVQKEKKEAVIAEFNRISATNRSDNALGNIVLKESGLSFHNQSSMDMSKLVASGIKNNLARYIQSFSKDTREIFKFDEFVSQLNDGKRLYKKGIGKYLDHKSKVLTDLTGKAKSAIELMLERRAALISAVVTGKIDVWEWNGVSKTEVIIATRVED